MDAKMTPAEVDKLLTKIILYVYYKQVYRQRDLRLWLAGLEMINRIPTLEARHD
jgi:hypothetical protein